VEILGQCPKERIDGKSGLTNPRRPPDAEGKEVVAEREQAVEAVSSAAQTFTELEDDDLQRAREPSENVGFEASHIDLAQMRNAVRADQLVESHHRDTFDSPQP
jgi:hypothetical protein